MNSRVGINNFPQREANVREKAPKLNRNDAGAMKKAFGDKNLGEVLNEIADPNFKARTRKVKGHGNAELGKDAFFKLMLTQLKQQDPTNPLKSHEMAAQLAQFSSVEQLANINEKLGKMSKGEGADQKYDVLSMIGKKVSGDSSRIDRMTGDKEHNVEFVLPKDADKVKLTIKDDKGIVIKKYSLDEMKKGKNRVVWNGLHDDGKDARVGQYFAHIEASNQGRKLTVDTKFSGVVDGVQFNKKGPVLMVDGKSLSMRDVRKIEVAENLKTKVNGKKNVVNPNSKMSEGAVLQASRANLDEIKMDKELRQKIEKK